MGKSPCNCEAINSCLHIAVNNIASRSMHAGTEAHAANGSLMGLKCAALQGVAPGSHCGDWERWFEGKGSPDGDAGIDVGSLGGDGGPVGGGRPRVLHQSKVDEADGVCAAGRHTLQVRAEHKRRRAQHLHQQQQQSWTMRNHCYKVTMHAAIYAMDFWCALKLPSTMSPCVDCCKEHGCMRQR